MLLEQILSFVIATVTLSPLIARVVSLTTRTWQDREYLEERRVRQVLIVAPVVTLFVFILFYFGILALLVFIEL